MKKAIITGVSGQDGSYLSELLLEKGYKVIGTVRRSAKRDFSNLSNVINNENFVLDTMEMSDYTSVNECIVKHQPDEIYNLAAMSFVTESFKSPHTTFESNTIGILNILETVRKYLPSCKVYQASTSEMFGKNYDTVGNKNVQSEKTFFEPQSPYAISKLAAHNLIRLYREYGINCSSGVLFNHECLSSFVPIIYKDNNVLHIDNISDFFKKYVNGPQGYVNNSIKIWDQEGWVDIKYASSFKHDLDNNKGLRIVNSRNSIYAVTNDHVCIKEDSSECQSKNLKVGDKVKLISYPENNIKFHIDLEFAEMLGMLVGDGHIKGRHGQFTNKNKEILNRFKYLWGKFGGNSKYYPSKSGFTDNEVGRLDLSNVKSVISEYSLYTDLLDAFGHRYKKIPYQILNSTKDCMEAFLIGYNVCDGLKKNKCKYRFKNFKTNSATLASGLIFLVSKVSGQKYNLTIEESWKHGKQQFYYSVNLLSDSESKVSKFNKVKNLLEQNIPQIEIYRQTNISRSFIRKVKNGYIPSNSHHLELCNNEIKKIIDIPNYDGWFFDLETSSGTFHAGIGNSVVHNSPRRGKEFVTRKITNYIGNLVKNCSIPHTGYGCQSSDDALSKGFVSLPINNGFSFIPSKLSSYEKLKLGNLDAYRDWGFAGDYVKAMWLMLQQDSMDDYVIATGETHSVRQFCEKAFSCVGLNYLDYIEVSSDLFRPAEVDYLCGDASKARKKLNWTPECSFDKLVTLMVHSDIWS